MNRGGEGKLVIVILAGVWKGSTFSRPECNFGAWQSAFGFGLSQGAGSKIRGFQCFSCLWYCYEDKGRKGSSNLNSIPCNETTLRLWRSNYSPEMWCNLSNDVVRLAKNMGSAGFFRAQQPASISIPFKSGLIRFDTDRNQLSKFNQRGETYMQCARTQARRKSILICIISISTWSPPTKIEFESFSNPRKKESWSW